MLFNRTPKIDTVPAKLDVYDSVIYVGPVWMGHIASLI
jgi:hypothetical protein